MPAVPLPDLILLDILMPGIDGYEVCRRLKENAGTKDIPIIFITGVSESLDDAKAFSLGAADYITKPFHVATVKARVKHQITLRNAIFELQRLNKIAMDANPITGLPGNNSIRQSIQASLDEGQNNFVMLVSEDTIDDIVEFIIERFDKDILNFYDAKDVEADSITGHQQGRKNLSFSTDEHQPGWSGSLPGKLYTITCRLMMSALK